MTSVIRGSDNMDSAQVRPVLMTAQTASGTAVDFTGIPSWVQRVTVMLAGVSLSGSSDILVQGGSGSVETTGYVSTANNTANPNAVSGASSTAGFIVRASAAANVQRGHFVLTLVSGNLWVASGVVINNTTNVTIGAGDKTFGGTLDRIRITTVNGTDTFDAGTISVLYE